MKSLQQVSQSQTARLVFLFFLLGISSYATGKIAKELIDEIDKL